MVHSRVLRRANILRRWIIWSTYLGCFSAGLSFQVGSVHLLFFYPVLAVNLALLLLMGYGWFPPGLFVLLGFTLLSGLTGLLQGTSSTGLLMKSLVGIWLAAPYACAFLRYMGFDAVGCFRRYAQWAYAVAVIGLPIFAMQLAIEGFGARLHSFELEPGEFCIVCLPALYYFLSRWQRSRVDGGKVLLMILTVALSRSSVGFLGVFFALYLFGSRYRFGAFVAPIAVALLGFGVYQASSDFRLRLNDSVNGFRVLGESEINGSSWSLVSGALVAERALQAHPFLGEGFGGINLINQRYAATIPGAEFINERVLHAAESDGGSLLFRLGAETGLIGLGLSMGFLWYCFPRGGTPEQKQVALAILVYSFLKLLRSGVYLSPEFMLLFTVYGVNGSPLLRRAAAHYRATAGLVAGLQG